MTLTTLQRTEIVNAIVSAIVAKVQADTYSYLSEYQVEGIASRAHFYGRRLPAWNSEAQFVWNVAGCVLADLNNQLLDFHQTSDRRREWRSAGLKVTAR